jgi:hypothetical protein
VTVGDIASSAALEQSLRSMLLQQALDVWSSVFVLCDIPHLSDSLDQCRQVPPSLSQTPSAITVPKKNAGVVLA